MLALLNPGDKILGFDLSHGGHLTHGSPVNFSGKLYNPVFYGVDKETGVINMDKVEEIAEKEQPKLIIAGASAYSQDWDYKRFREIADKVGAILLADVSHFAGLIAAGLMNDPVPHCHVVTTTTHKTLRGPRGGLILVGKDGANPLNIQTSKGKLKRMSTIFNSAVFPGSQGGPLEHVVAAKAVGFYENLTDEFRQYAKQVIKNAQAMADAFIERGFKVISGGTKNHLMLIDLRSKGATGKYAEETLEKADITLNKNMVPFDEQPALVTSGIRIGTSAVTTRGMKEDEMRQIVDMIDRIVLDENKVDEVKQEVKELAGRFPLYQ
jgi:glycine hydroxymethyltransferase